MNKIKNIILAVYGTIMFIVCFFGKMIWEILTVKIDEEI